MKISYSYTLLCQLSKFNVLWWLFVDNHGSITFPVLLPIDIEKTSWLLKHTLLIFFSLFNSWIWYLRAVHPTVFITVLWYWWVTDNRHISNPISRSSISEKLWGKTCDKHNCFHFNKTSAISHCYGLVFCAYLTFCPVGSWIFHDDVIKWKHFPRYWPFVWVIHQSTVNYPHKGQWREALMFSLICAWLNGWVNNREAGDLRCHPAHYDVIVMWLVEIILDKVQYCTCAASRMQLGCEQT